MKNPLSSLREYENTVIGTCLAIKYCHVLEWLSTGFGLEI
jgi:hypothetical protein